jgi:hypothetical protein
MFVIHKFFFYISSITPYSYLIGSKRKMLIARAKRMLCSSRTEWRSTIQTVPRQATTADAQALQVELAAE